MMKPIETTLLRKQLQQQKNQFLSQKALLQQKIQILSEQLQEYRQRQSEHKMLNQSIMATFKHKQSAIQNKSSQTIKQLKSKHQKELHKMKIKYQQEFQKLTIKLKQLKTKYQNSVIQSQKQKLEQEKRKFQFKKLYQDKMSMKLRQKQRQSEATVQKLQQKLKQAEKMGELYEQFLQKNKQRQLLHLPEANQNLYNQVNSGVTERMRGSSRNSISHQCLKQNGTINQKSKANISRRMGLAQTLNTYNINDLHSKCGLTRQQTCADLRKYQESNRKSKQIASSNKESIKALSVKLERAIADLKPNKNQRILKNHKLSQRLNHQFKKIV